MPPMLRLAFCTVLSDIPASAAAFTMSSLASSFPSAKQVKYQPFSLFGLGGVVAARAGQQLVGGDVVFAYPRKARFRVKAKGNGLALRRKGRFVMDDNAHIRLPLHAPDQQDAPCCGAEVDRT